MAEIETSNSVELTAFITNLMVSVYYEPSSTLTSHAGAFCCGRLATGAITEASGLFFSHCLALRGRTSGSRNCKCSDWLSLLRFQAFNNLGHLCRSRQAFNRFGHFYRSRRAVIVRVDQLGRESPLRHQNYVDMGVLCIRSDDQRRCLATSSS